jgi:hypothetical protein
MVTVLLDTLPAPSTDRLDKVYRQVKDILSIIATLQAESSRQHRADVSISSLGCSMANRILASLHSGPRWLVSFEQAYIAPITSSGPLGG